MGVATKGDLCFDTGKTSSPRKCYRPGGSLRSTKGNEVFDYTPAVNDQLIQIAS